MLVCMRANSAYKKYKNTHCTATKLQCCNCRQANRWLGDVDSVDYKAVWCCCRERCDACRVVVGHSNAISALAMMMTALNASNTLL